MRAAYLTAEALFTVRKSYDIRHNAINIIFITRAPLKYILIEKQFKINVIICDKQ
jgi:hypothetical protein